MRIAFHTYDLFPGRERLMPWRTIIEVAKYLIASDYDVDIVSTSTNGTGNSYNYQGVNIKNINAGYPSLVECIQTNDYNVVFLPFTWRDGLKDLSALSKLKCRKFAYFPGGVYHFKNVLSLLFKGGFSIAKPYLLERFSSKKLLLKKMKSIGVEHVVVLSFLTEKYIRKCGFSNVQTILPGKDNMALIEGDDSLLIKNNLENHKFFLFMGAPAVIRGSRDLLLAFDSLATKQKDAKIIFLMRTDVGSEYGGFQKVYKKCKNKSQIIILKESLSRGQLKAFLEKAYAVILPFIAIPSEIPLTYFEVLSLASPIISYKNGGTTDYLNEVILTAKPGVKRSLVAQMKKLWNDSLLQSNLSKKSEALMSKHPEWDAVCKKWEEVIKS